MDEYNSGMDPEVKIYFRKIMKSFTVGLLWLLLAVTFGIFFRLGHLQNGLHWYNGVFYFLMLLSLAAVLRFLYKVWKKK